MQELVPLVSGFAVGLAVWLLILVLCVATGRRADPSPRLAVVPA